MTSPARRSRECGAEIGAGGGLDGHWVCSFGSRGGTQPAPLPSAAPSLRPSRDRPGYSAAAAAAASAGMAEGLGAGDGLGEHVARPGRVAALGEHAAEPQHRDRGERRAPSRVVHGHGAAQAGLRLVETAEGGRQAAQVQLCRAVAARAARDHREADRRTARADRGGGRRRLASPTSAATSASRQAWSQLTSMATPAAVSRPSSSRALSWRPARASTRATAASQGSGMGALLACWSDDSRSISATPELACQRQFTLYSCRAAARSGSAARAADRLGLVGERRALVPAAGQERQASPPQRHVPAVVRQPDLVREPLVAVDLAPQLVHAAKLQQVDHAPVAGLQHGLAVAGRLRRDDHLVHDVEPAACVGRPPQRYAPCVERGRQRARVAAGARVRHRLLAERLGAGRVGVVALDREPRVQARSRRPAHPRGSRRAPPRAASHSSGSGAATTTARPGEPQARLRTAAPRRRRRGPARRPRRNWRARRRVRPRDRARVPARPAAAGRSRAGGPAARAAARWAAASECASASVASLAAAFDQRMTRSVGASGPAASRCDATRPGRGDARSLERVGYLEVQPRTT